MRKLTSKQALFVKEYLVDMNACAAAIRAGYSDKTAKEIGHQNLQKTSIKAAVEEALSQRNEKLDIDSEYVLSRLIEIDKMDVIDILMDDGSIKPIREWPKSWRTTISGLDVSELFDGKSDTREISAVLKKIKWPDKIRNLELLGKHVDIQAFKDKVEHEGEIKTPTPVINLVLNGGTES